MQIFHRIVLSVFTVTTFGKVGVHANNKKCEWENNYHNHGDWFKGPTLTCYCDNGRWGNCRDNGSVQSSSSQAYHGNHAASSSSSSSSDSSDDSKKDCKYKHYTTSHGDSLRGDTQTCDCVDGKWRNCSTHSYDDKRCKRDGNKYDFQEWHTFQHQNVTVLMIMYGSVVKTWIILSNVIMIPENIRLATGAMIRMDAVNANLMAIGNVKTTRNVAETGISMNWANRMISMEKGAS
eukprot:CAMPEP_0170996142 /NCGR_PEP_ID=MMETSP0736-20130129/12044_1 /TAXON_ID=186038 /ORGANISM="Fragilariopsis kerguelensis, Strain L26-C5" /LENGTH=234 /DNA_ID=CAMNT_0011422497 /DNA_START=150 /DNA_END=852 /DNA_ORIENTATION=+